MLKDYTRSKIMYAYSQFTPPDKTQLDGRVASCRAVWIGH